MRTATIFTFLTTAASLVMAQLDFLSARSPTGRLSRCDPPASLGACRNDCSCDLGAAKPDCGHPVCSDHCWCSGGSPPPPYPPSPPPPSAHRPSRKPAPRPRPHHHRREDVDEDLEGEAQE